MGWLQQVVEVLSRALEQGNLAWWALAVTAFVALAAVVYEAMAGSRRSVVPASARAHVFEHLKHGRRTQALQHSQQDDSPFSQVVRAALRLPQDAPSYIVYAAIEEAANREVALLRARVSFLGGLSVVALLVGTLGALGGMLAVLASATGAVTVAALAAQAAEALRLALSAGVLAAVVAGFYYVFLTRLHLVEATLWSEVQRLTAMLAGRKFLEEEKTEARQAEAPEENAGQAGEKSDEETDA